MFSPVFASCHSDVAVVVSEIVVDCVEDSGYGNL